MPLDQPNQPSNKRPMSPLPASPAKRRKKSTRSENTSTSTNVIWWQLGRSGVSQASITIQRSRSAIPLFKETREFFSRVFNFLSLLQEEYKNTPTRQKNAPITHYKIYMPKRLLMFLVLDSLKYNYELTISMFERRLKELCVSDLDVYKSHDYYKNIQLLQRMCKSADFGDIRFFGVFKLLILPFIKGFLDKYGSDENFKDINMKGTEFEGVSEAIRASIAKRLKSFGIEKEKSSDDKIERIFFDKSPSSYNKLAKVLLANSQFKSGKVLSKLSKEIPSPSAQQQQPQQRVNTHSENVVQPRQPQEQRVNSIRGVADEQQEKQDIREAARVLLQLKAAAFSSNKAGSAVDTAPRSAFVPGSR